MPLLKPEDAKDHVGAYRTSSLFFETNQSTLEPVFTLKKEDLYKDDGEKVYYSIYPLYMSIADPTEYDFALAVFGSWHQWEKILEGTKIRAVVQQWRDELEVKLRSEALQSIARLAQDDQRGFQAAKYMAEGGWKQKKVGRPTKAHSEREEGIERDLMAQIEDDMNRISGKAH